MISFSRFFTQILPIVRYNTNELYNCYQDLDIHTDVTSGKIMPGEYLILKFNFAEISRTPDLNKAARSLAANITLSLVQFYRTYNRQLGLPLSQLQSEMVDSSDPIHSFQKSRNVC